MSHQRTWSFTTNLRWKPAFTVLSAEDAPTLSVQPPVDFGGDGLRWSPESMLVGAVESCTLFTFLSEARRQKLAIISYQSSAQGLLARDDEGIFRFTEIVVRPFVQVDSHERVRAARRIFDELEKKCFIGSSLKASPRIEAQVVLADLTTAYREARVISRHCEQEEGHDSNPHH